MQDPSKHAKAWEELKSCHGVLVPGGFGSRGLEGKIQAIRYARWVSQSSTQAQFSFLLRKMVYKTDAMLVFQL